MGFQMLCSSKSTESEEVGTDEASDPSIAHQNPQPGKPDRIEPYTKIDQEDDDTSKTNPKETQRRTTRSLLIWRVEMFWFDIKPKVHNAAA